MGKWKEIKLVVNVFYVSMSGQVPKLGLKCHYDEIFDIPFFTFSNTMSFLDILPNFNLLRTLELAVFRPLFPRIYGRH